MNKRWWFDNNVHPWQGVDVSKRIALKPLIKFSVSGSSSKAALRSIARMIIWCKGPGASMRALRDNNLPTAKIQTNVNMSRMLPTALLEGIERMSPSQTFETRKATIRSNPFTS